MADSRCDAHRHSRLRPQPGRLNPARNHATIRAGLLREVIELAWVATLSAPGFPLFILPRKGED
jgi:hypothetical protein